MVAVEAFALHGLVELHQLPQGVEGDRPAEEENDSAPAPAGGGGAPELVDMVEIGGMAEKEKRVKDGMGGETDFCRSSSYV